MSPPLPIIPPDLELAWQRLDLLCRELFETEDMLADFLHEYYGKTGRYIEALGKRRPTQENIVTLHDDENGECMSAANASTRQQCLAPSQKDYGNICPPASVERHTRDIYLLLVRRHHPDTSPDTTDHTLIKTITAFYRQRQYGSLWKAACEQEATKLASRQSELYHRLMVYYRAQADLLIRSMENRLKNLRDSAEYHLWLRVFTARLRGEDLLEEITRHLQRELAHASISSEIP